DGDALLLGDLAQGLDQGEVVLEVVALEAGRVGAEVVRGEPLAGRDMAGDQPAGEHGVRGDGDAELAQGGQDLPLGAPGDERVLDLEVGDRGGGGGPADGLRTDLAEPDVADVPL